MVGTDLLPDDTKPVIKPDLPSSEIDEDDPSFISDKDQMHAEADSILNSNPAESSSGSAEPKSGRSSSANDQTSSTTDSSNKSESEERNLFNPNPSDKGYLKGGFKNFFWGTRRRKLLSSSVVGGGGVIGFIMFLIFTAAGPAQLIQLSSILQKNFSSMNQASADRVGVELADGTSSLAGAPQDLGATRLGNLTQLVLKPILKYMSNAGIEPVFNDTHGLSGYTIDPELFATRDPEFAGLSTLEEKRAYLENNFSDIKGLTVGIDEKSGLITLTDPNNPVDLLRVTIRGVNSNLADLISGDGVVSNIIGAMSARVISIYEGAPSLLFHPLKTISEAVRRNAGIKAAQNQENKDNQQAAEDEQSGEVEAVLVGAEDSPAEVATLRGTLNKAFGSTIGKTVTSVLIGQAVYCELYNNVGNIINFNHDAIVLPSAVEATRMIAIGDQVKSGEDISSTEVGNVVNTLSDSQGQTVWSAKSLQVEENVQNPSGPDLPSDDYQAFSGTTAANTIENSLNSHGISSVTCSPLAEVVNAFIGLVALVAVAPTDGTSLAAYYSVKLGSSAGFGFALYFVSHDILTGALKDNAVIPEVLSGPLGGNILAYGARAASNISAMSSGGVALSNTQSTALAYKEQAQSNKQFASESLFSRLFNIDDNRSLLGKIADSIRPNFMSDVLSFAKSLLNVGQIASKIMSIFSPKTSADSSTTYNWGFPQYGIPSQILDSTDPTMSDPFANASLVVPLLQNDTDSVIERAQTCFGDKISNTSSGWDAAPIPNADVNPDSQAYENANCNDSSENWQRIILFVFDTRNMQAVACYEGDSGSCGEIGF